MPRGGEHHGIVRAREGLERFRLERFPIEPRLAPWIEHAWSVEYDLPRGQVHRQKVLSYPNVHLVFEAVEECREAWVYGIPERPYERTLEGRGWALGLRFRPGGFRAFWEGELKVLTGTRREARPWLRDDPSLETVFAAPDAASRALAAQRALVEPKGASDPDALEIEALVRRMAQETGLRSVEDLCVSAGIPMRRMQRLFARYVGVSPRWVLQRFRLQEAAARLDLDAEVDLVRLALELGYFDQAHFTRDFKAVLGETPAAYRRRMLEVRCP